ncbi:hypothetical protein K469DRAFT_168877 [Zopfia rhizophila CBS 207.26]|uniref:Uncharacterized protein n=1 Tax=Zopfia rhizophila CBS 207.26 TaxID=1314779 RepID=A0A6A6E3E3_9PEZI|nr:hypothetical protein K469DRAFT_168877 [Zopfia rhizophila CBS 207.26]
MLFALLVQTLTHLSAFEVLSVVRPLTLKEMNIALAIEDESRLYKSLDLENEVTFESTIRNLCGLFITVVDLKS